MTIFRQRQWLPKACILVIVWLAYLLRVFHIANQSYWWDELATVGRSILSIPDLFENLFQNISHVPLYFILIRGWGELGQDEFILRYFSLIFGLLSVGLIYRTGQLIGGWKVGISAALLLAVSPFNIWYSQEARMYSFVAFTVLAANWFILKILRGDDQKDWVGYLLAMLISVYSHYLTIFILVAHYAYFSIHYRINKRFLRQWIIYGGIVGILFVLWVLLILSKGGYRNAPIGWIAPANWYQPFFTLLSLSIGPSINPQNPIVYITLLVYLVALIVGIRYYIKIPSGDAGMTPDRIQSMSYRLLLVWLFLPILLVFVISLDMPIPEKRSVYMDRYLTICLPALNLLGAWGLVTLAQKSGRRWLLPLGLLLITLISATTLRNMYFESEYSRDDWRGAMAFMADEWQRDDVYLVQPSQPLVVFQYRQDPVEYELIPQFSASTSQEKLKGTELADWIASIALETDRAWLLTAIENVNPHGFPQARNRALLNATASSSMEKYLAKNCSQVNEWLFTGVRLTLYNLDTCPPQSSTHLQSHS